MVINHLLTGMILQVPRCSMEYLPYTKSPSFTINWTQVSSTFAQEHGGSLREKPSGAIRSEGPHTSEETVDPGNVDV